MGVAQATTMNPGKRAWSAGSGVLKNRPAILAMPAPAPILALDHEWHRQRASLRSGTPGRSGALLRPPPLVAAGLEIEHDADTGRRVKVGGLVVIFGHFPATLADFVHLAHARLHLQPEQARELDPILNTRVMALWAWLPTVRRDCYLELDRATGEVNTWLVGPGAATSSRSKARRATRTTTTGSSPDWCSTAMPIGAANADWRDWSNASAAPPC